jgi:hypothetical protein
MIKQKEKCHRQSVIGKKLSEMCQQVKVSINITASLSHILRSPLPASASATKQAYQGKLRRRWENFWDTSDRSRRMEEIDDNFPFNAFRANSYQLTRHQASLMMQIRCGHIPLNGYLHKIGRSDSEFCQACLVNREGLRCRETVNHFLFECKSHTLRLQ